MHPVIRKCFWVIKFNNKPVWVDLKSKSLVLCIHFADTSLSNKAQEKTLCNPLVVGLLENDNALLILQSSQVEDWMSYSEVNLWAYPWSTCHILGGDRKFYWCVECKLKWEWIIIKRMHFLIGVHNDAMMPWDSFKNAVQSTRFQVKPCYCSESRFYDAS